LGAVAYFLVTGEPVFGGSGIGEVLMHQVSTQPERPSTRLTKPLSTDFEDLIMRCLAKKQLDRPASARDLETALSQCSAAAQWRAEDAEDWWRRHNAANAERTIVVEKQA